MVQLGKPNIEKLEAKRNIRGLIKAFGYGSLREGENIRKEAIEALGRIGGARALEALVDATMHFYPDVRSTASKELARIGEPAVDPVMVLLRQGDRGHVKNIRQMAANALAEIGTPAVELLIIALRDDDHTVRSSAAKALSKIGDDRAIEPLISALSDGASICRRAAAGALGKIGDARAVEPLIYTLRDRDSQTAETAAKAIVRIIEYADVTESVRQSALEAISWGKAKGWGKLTFDVEVPSEDGFCSDDKCPCNETAISRGTGYLYISQDVVNFRGDALTLQAAQNKVRILKQRMGGAVFFGTGAITPILMCKQGAELRGLDLEVASQDARYWWETGTVPLRATPIAVKNRSRHLAKSQLTKISKPSVKPPVRENFPQPPIDQTPSVGAQDDTLQPAVIDSGGDFSFLVSAVFMMKEKGLVATGQVSSGTITPGEVVEVETSTGILKAKVVELGMFAKQLKKASAGEEVGLTLEGIDSLLGPDQVKAGMIIRSGT